MIFPTCCTTEAVPHVAMRIFLSKCVRSTNVDITTASCFFAKMLDYIFRTIHLFSTLHTRVVFHLFLPPHLRRCVHCFGVFCVKEASACGVFVDERRVTEERGGFATVLTFAVREDLGGFQDFALERRVKEDLGGISFFCLLRLYSLMQLMWARGASTTQYVRVVERPQTETQPFDLARRKVELATKPVHSTPTGLINPGKYIIIKDPYNKVTREGMWTTATPPAR